MSFMEQQPPSLTPQEIAARQDAEYAHIGQPQAVKIFGILHCVLGVYGVLTVAFAIMAMLGFNPFLAMVPKTAATSAQMTQQASMQTEMIPVNIATTLIAVATTAFIITSGILMLKRRRSGLKWSNRYAWTSLLGKAVAAGVAFFYTYPMMKKITSGLGSPGMPGAMEGVMIGSMVFGIVISCVYPILSLVLLNRPKTKEWFANQPE